MKKKKCACVVCVTGQVSSDRIIKVARAITDGCGAPLHVLSIMPLGASPEELEALEYLNDIARDAGAEMSVFCSENPALAAVSYIQHKKITHVITGVPGENSSGFVELVRSVLPKVRVITVAQEIDDGELFTGLPARAFG